jgi:hypothetical protein
MPVRLSQLTAGATKRVAIPFGDDVLNVDYRPGAVTPLLEAKEIEFRERGMALSGVAAFLDVIISGWDLVDDKGKPIAPTKAVFESFGMDTLMALTRAIQADLVPNPPTSNGSSSSG